ncbi:hypothetical protein FRC10_004339, partial [Ceratobasidium sp. 414]
MKMFKTIYRAALATQVLTNTRLPTRIQSKLTIMHFSTTCIALVATAAAFVAGSPVEKLTKRDISYGNPDLVTDQGDRFKLNYGSTEGHENACPGHFICCDRLADSPTLNVDIFKNGAPQDDVSLGDPDDMVDEGSRWRLNYGSASGHPNACDGHF